MGIPTSISGPSGRLQEGAHRLVPDLARMADDRLKVLEERTRYEPADVEGRVFARWDEAGIFHPKPEGTPAENFSIAVPPPNVTGNLHMGHALNASIQDL